MNDQQQPIATHEELSYELALRAHSGTSFVPEDRAKMEQREYVNSVTATHDDLLKFCKTNEQRAVLDREFPIFKAAYLKHYGAYLASRGNVVSSMIAGPSNFPAARMNNKRRQWADNKLNEFIQWRERAVNAIKRHILDARSDELKESDEWMRLQRDICSSLATICQIDAGASFYTRSSFVNSIAGKVERLAANGEVGLVERAIEQVQKYNAVNKKPAISARHKFWGFLDVAKANAAKNAEPAGDASVIFAVDGVEVVRNPQADRIQILFPGKPDEAMRNKLKAAGWRWSPSEGTWQRQITNAAEWSARQILGVTE